MNNEDLKLLTERSGKALMANAELMDAIAAVEGHEDLTDMDREFLQHSANMVGKARFDCLMVQCGFLLINGIPNLYPDQELHE